MMITESFHYMYVRVMQGKDRRRVDGSTVFVWQLMLVVSGRVARTSCCHAI